MKRYTLRCAVLAVAMVPLLWPLAACDREPASAPKLTQTTKEGTEAQLGPVQRVELASASIPSGREKDHLFKILSVTVPPGETITYASAEGLVFQISGSQTITVEGRATTLQPNQGVHIETGLPAIFESHGKEEPSVYLHFLLVPAPQADRTIALEKAKITELYRTPNPVPDLAKEPHQFTLAQLSFPPATPQTGTHYRTGAAVYYVLSGTGTFSHQGTTEQKGPGSVVYEPSGMVHQWANPGDLPLQLIVANVSPTGTPAIQVETPS